MFVTTERFIRVECVRTRIFRGSLQFAPGFCSSPPSASPSCCSRHHRSVLCSFCPLIRITIRERPSRDLFAPSVSTAAELRSFASAALQNVTVKNECFGSSQLRAGFSAIGLPVQMHGEGLLGLHRKIDLLVRRTQSNQVLRVECAESCRDGWPDAYDALLYSGPKQCNPKIAAKEQLRAAHRGRTPGMGRAINLHLLDRLPCIVHATALTGGMTVFVHLRL